MRVLHIQTSMTPAGNAAYRLHLAMRREGVDSSVMTYKPFGKRNFVSSFKSGYKVLLSKVVTELFMPKVVRKPLTYSYSQMPLLSKGIAHSWQVKEADVIYLHWVCGGFIGLNDIEELAKTGKPIFFFMHDMWTFTGGCHHSFECKQYESGCKNCPILAKNIHMADRQSKKKKELFEQFPNLFFISPSEWMASCARSSSILKNKPIYAISNVVDETIFKPVSKEIARVILNLPTDKKIISFGCQAGTNNPFKGWKFLQEAINMLEDENLHLVVFGSDYDKTTEEQLKYPVSFMGAILDEHVLALISAASDVFVSPSLAESFGLTFLENILCDTPVVGFDNTAVPEIVVNEKTGYLARNKDSEDLSKGIQKCLSAQISPREVIAYSSCKIVKKHLQYIGEALKNN